MIENVSPSRCIENQSLEIFLLWSQAKTFSRLACDRCVVLHFQPLKTQRDFGQPRFSFTKYQDTAFQGYHQGNTGIGAMSVPRRHNTPEREFVQDTHPDGELLKKKRRQNGAKSPPLFPKLSDKRITTADIDNFDYRTLDVKPGAFDFAGKDGLFSLPSLSKNRQFVGTKDASKLRAVARIGLDQRIPSEIRDSDSQRSSGSSCVTEVENPEIVKLETQKAKSTSGRSKKGRKSRKHKRHRSGHMKFQKGVLLPKNSHDGQYFPCFPDFKPNNGLTRTSPEDGLCVMHGYLSRWT